MSNENINARYSTVEKAFGLEKEHIYVIVLHVIMSQHWLNIKSKWATKREQQVLTVTVGFIEALLILFHFVMFSDLYRFYGIYKYLKRTYHYIICTYWFLELLHSTFEIIHPSGRTA